ncbi:hypothetical protein [Iningainema tapete]|uniref:Uncharacterized protein n=1 Tax=Iningainema tapete BLCC-T55 TaxID=2748662 RepID=A0A8J6XGP7_9CYAN|nr:hypothetical protein [Iningainema tapete]MBD2775569.1 hypothetical protein [Iningainema tapete BLCC-T55]
MIKNELEYNVTKSWVEKMGRATAALVQDEEKKKNQSDVWQLHYDGVTSQQSDLLEQVAEYEALVTHNPNESITLSVECMNKISDLLIKARIAFKITQKELASLCDRSEEQIKLFEDKDYQNATFLDFLAVSDALGVEIIDGKFIAKMDEFYLKRLEAIRASENIDAGLKAAS